MGRASISINVTSQFDGKAMDSAISKMELLAQKATMTRGKIGNSMVDTGVHVSQMGGMIESAGKKIENVGKALTKGITMPLVGLTAATVPAALELNTAFYDLRKTLDTTEEGYQKLKQGAIEYSNIQPVSAAQILSIEGLGAQLGVAEQNLQSFAKVASGLDIATDLDAETASTQMAQFANIVQMSQKDFDRYGATVVDLGNHTATTESQISGMALKFASAGHQAGMTESEILGISAALSSLGMKADAGGSALSQSINQIDLAVATSNEDLHKWAELAGKSSEEFARAWKTNAADTFIDVMTGIANSGTETSAILEDLGITQIRQSDAMRRLAGSGDLLTNTVKRANQAWQENTALQKEVDSRNESLQSRFDALKNRWTNVAAEFGEPLAEALLNVTDAFNPLLDGVHGLVDGFNSLAQPQQQAIVNFGVMAAAAGPILQVVGKLTQGFGKVTQWVGKSTRNFGVFRENLNTTDLGMIKLGQTTNDFSTRLGLMGNKLVRQNGGLDAFIEKSNNYIKQQEDSARKEEAQKIQMEHRADAMEAVKAKTEALTTAEKNHTSVVKEGKDLAVERDMLTSKIAATRGELTTATNKAQKSEKEYTDLLERQKNLPAEIARETEKANLARQREKELNDELYAMMPARAKAAVDEDIAKKKAAAATTSAYKATDKATISAKAETEAIEKAVNARKSQLEVTQQNIATQERYSKLQSARKKATEEAEEAERRVAEAQGFRASSTAELAQKERQMLEDREKRAKAEAKLETLTSKREDVRAKITENSKKETAADKEKTKATKELTAANEHLDKVNKGQIKTQEDIQRINKASSDASVKAAEDIGKGAVNLDQYGEKVSKLQQIMGKVKTGITGMGQAIAGAFMGMLPGLAITAVIAGITALVAAIEEAKQKAETFRQATTGVTDAVSNIGNAINGGITDINGYGNALQTLGATSIDYTEVAQDMVERNAALSQSLNDIATDLSAQEMEFAEAGAAIEAYYGQMGNSTDASTQLASALDVVAGAFDNLSVNQDNMLYNNMTGEILESKAAVEALTAAIERQAEIQAVANAKAAIQTERLTNEAKYNAALAERKALQAEVNQKQDEWQRLSDKGFSRTAEETQQMYQLNSEINTTNQRIGELDSSMSSMQAVIDSNRSALAQLGAQERELTQAQRELGETYLMAIEQMDGGVTALNNLGEKTTAFGQALSKCRANMETFGQLTSEQIQQVAAEFDGSTQSMLDSIQRINPEVFTQMMGDWKGSFTSEIQSGLDEAARVVDGGMETLFKTASEFGLVGQEYIKAFTDAINSGAPSVEAAALQAFNQVKSAAAGSAPEIADSLFTPLQSGFQTGFGNLQNTASTGIQNVAQATNQPWLFTNSMNSNTKASETSLSTGMGTVANTAATKTQEVATATDKPELFTTAFSNNAQGASTGWEKSLKISEPTGAELLRLDGYTGQANNTGSTLGGALTDGWTEKTSETNTMEGFSTSVNGQLETIGTELGTKAGEMGTKLITDMTTKMSEQSESVQTIGKTMADGMRTGFEQAEWGTTLDTVMQTITDKFSGEGVSTIGQGLGDAIKTGIDTSNIPGKMDEVMTTLSTNINTQLQSISLSALAAGMATGTLYAAGFSVGSAGAVQAAANLTSMVAMALANGAGTALASGIATGSGYTSGLTAGLAPAPGVTAAIVAAVIAMLTTGIARSRTVGIQTGQAYAQGILSTRGMVIAAALSLVNAVIQTLQLGIAQARAKGVSTGQAYAAGVSSQTGAARSAGNALKNAALAAMSGGAEDARAKGAAIGAAYAAGINSSVGAVEAAASRLRSAVAGATSAAASLASINNTVKTVSLPGGSFIGSVEDMTNRVQTFASIGSLMDAAQSLSTNAVQTYASEESKVFQNGQRIGLAYAQGIASAAGAVKTASSGGGQATYNIYIDGAKVNDDEGIRQVTADYLVRLKQLAEI